VSLGTSGVLFAANAAYLPKPESAVHAFCHALPNTWHQMGVILSATDALNWHSSVTGKSAADLTTELGETLKAPSGVTFLPYLSGERTPHNDPHVRGAFLGMGNDTDSGRLAAAVLEGVAFAHADGLDALREAGTTITSLSVIGGGARSSYWGRIIAASLGVPLVYLEGGEVGPALGAARLAQIAVTGARAAQVCVRPPVSHVVEPDAALADLLAPKLARFRAAYPLVRQIQE